MACVACEIYAKRITNIFRDDALKIKFVELTSCQVKNDCFICDECNDKLESAFAFRNQCIEVYRRLNPPEVGALMQEHDFQEQVGTEENSVEQFSITRDEDETVKDEEEGTDNFAVPVNEKSFNEVEQDQDFETVYLEYETEDQEHPEEQNSYDRPRTRLLETSDERCILNRKSYTVVQKLKIIDYAEQHNNRQAARHFSMNESSIRCFRRQKDILLKMSPEKKTNRKAFPHWPDLEKELKEFVENYPSEHGVKAKLKDIKQQAIVIAKKRGIDNFNGSNSYIFKFMQRNHIPSASPRPRKQQKFDPAEVIISSRSLSCHKK